MDEFKDIKLIVSEIDGVLTDGTYAEDEMGHVLYKRYNAKDFAAINVLKRQHKIVFLSDDNNINYNMCRRKNIPFYWAKTEQEKYDRLVEIMHRYDCLPDYVLYVGGKLTDVQCCQFIPHSLCPDDAGTYLKDTCWATFKIKSGEGIFVELLDLLNQSPLSDVEP